jgi:hypothetical protein
MKVRMLQQVSGTRAGVEWPPIGGEVDLPDEEAEQLVASGLAERVADKPRGRRSP